MYYTEQISSQKTTYNMLWITSFVGAVQACSNCWCHRELSAEIMAKKLMQDQTNQISSPQKVKFLSLLHTNTSMFVHMGMPQSFCLKKNRLSKLQISTLH